MSYRLGIDLGTTYTAAAVGRGTTATMASLGDRTPEIPSVLAFPADGETLVGDPAVRRVFTDPTRIAREFKRRLGDPVPLIVGGSPRSAESLTAALLRHVIDRVTAVEGGGPDRIVVTVPANWGPYKLSTMEQVFQLAAVTGARLLAEPVAAAHYYAHEGRVADGATVVVFDFGGGTFDAAIVRRDGPHFRMLGEAKGLERLGGVDLDHAVLDHALRTSTIDLSQVDQTEDAIVGIARLRQDCTLAKEALSYDSSAAIPIVLPGRQTTVRLNRSEFEEMIRPSIHDAVTTVETMVSEAGMSLPQIDAVLLVGGSSRIPLVGQILAERLARPIVSDAHPKHTIALGAALSAEISESAEISDSAARPAMARAPVSAPPIPEPPIPAPPTRPTPAAEPEPRPTPSPRPSVSPSAAPPDQARPPRPEEVTTPPSLAGRRIYLAAIVGSLLVAVIGFLALRSGGDEQPTALDAASQGAATSTTSAAGEDSETTADDSASETTSTATLDTGTLDTGTLDTSIGPTTRLENATSYAPTAKSFSGEGPAEAPSLLWERETTAFSGAVGAGGLVFTFQPSGQSSTNQLQAFQGIGGDPVWTGSSIAVHNTVAAHGGLVAISDAKTTQVLSVANGETIAVATPTGLDPNAVHSGVTVRNGTAFAWGTARSSSDERLYIVATDIASNETLWLFEDSSPTNLFIRTVVDDDVVVADNEEFRVGLDAKTGAELWRSTDVDGTVLLLVDGGVMLVSTIGGELRGLDARTGAELWTDTSSVGLRAAGDGQHFFTTNIGDSILLARALADGSPLWAQPVSTAGWTSSGAITILLGQDTVYTVVDGVGTARSKSNGNLIWSEELEGLDNNPVRNAAVADGRLLLVDESQRLRVYGTTE